MTRDAVSVRDGMAVGARVGTHDGIDWHASLNVRRWDADQTRWVAGRLGLLQPQAADFARAGVRPYSESDVEHNLLTTAGLTRITALINAGGGNAVTSTTTRVGAGNGVGTAAVGDTDLSAAAGSANRWFQSCTVSVSAGVITMSATFGTADGNFAWNEWGADVGTTNTSGNTVAAVLLNHKTSIAQGTKASGQTWTATATITLS